MAIEKIKILGAVLELPAKFSLFTTKKAKWAELVVLFGLFPLRPMPPNLLDIIKWTVQHVPGTSDEFELNFSGSREPKL